MKFTLAVLSSVLSAGMVSAAPMDTCGAQATCMHFTIEETTGPECNTDCHYKVCMEYANFEGCVKSGDYFSHTCVKDDATCMVSSGFGTASNEGSSSTYANEFGVQCQMIPPGGKAEFLVKDGTDHCSTAVKEYTIGGTSYTAECNDIKDNVGMENCAGNGMESNNNGCVWVVDVPPSCSGANIVTDPPIPVTTTVATTTVATTGATTVATTVAATDPATTPAATTTGNTVSDAGGDPHFARWGQEHDSFHGECDLVLVHSEDFHNGAGFDLHARTTIQDYFSYIETAALRVGDNTLEFYQKNFFLNGVELTPADLPITFGGDFKYTITNAPVDEGKNPKFYQYYKVDLHQDSSILFKFYKQYLTMSISGNPMDFADAAGLLGEFPSGKMITRDGEEMTDFVSYGFEWQVAPDDSKLFRDARAPQLPYEQCRMPTAARPARRALRGDNTLMQEASKACAHVAGKGFELCIDDVLTTGDAGIAGTW